MNEILILGSVAVDEVVSLEQPLRAGSHNGGRSVGTRIGGGAANTAMALARAGYTARVVSAVGNDASGQEVLCTLEMLGVDIGLIRQDAACTTRSLVLLDAAGERTVVNLARSLVPIPEDFAHLPAACCYVRSADPSLAPVLAERRKRGLVIAHVPPVSEGLRPADVLVGSASDLDAAFFAAPFERGRQVAGDALQWVVITDGANGATAYSELSMLHAPAPIIDVVDSTGAGDAFVAGLAGALAQGESMELAMKRAVAWGSASVGYAGTVPPQDFSDRVSALLAAG